ncbi:MAG TPA: Maf family protein, partial [Candidatus Eremiobacteraceae bacterium]|nr:Maf family protein [Candidatus Eremiobacteraceae bacterium]
MTERLREVSLASASPRRFQLLSQLGLTVVVVPSAYRESDDTGIRAGRELALRHAIGKADGARRDGPPLLVAADT